MPSKHDARICQFGKNGDKSHYSPQQREKVLIKLKKANDMELKRIEEVNESCRKSYRMLQEAKVVAVLDIDNGALELLDEPEPIKASGWNSGDALYLQSFHF
jgi:hypothetical protein